MSVQCQKISLSFLLLCWMTMFVWGCEEHYRDKWVQIDYYIVNGREDEILVKNKDGAGGIVGFFLAPGESYHFSYHGNMAFRITDRDPRGIRLIFDFYASGDDARFDQYISTCEFCPQLENHACVETCFVH
ncbi:hypothetical protein AMJ44_13115 [candidate division WOR-1 bacterium DG_54_3]|uniref:Uncharacterized protein n=1 Tax=candidate division WOR-1 bacterium DG_54_3 TaxID=1703775 RepID=A0A0S7XP26_UNCSA|nr:MAG: hypothetical protein AMJ44_13115 [candidate division WOR-1 bacterium DG_54_3]